MPTTFQKMEPLNSSSISRALLDKPVMQCTINDKADIEQAIRTIPVMASYSAEKAVH